ncbi:hypothetical protein E3Q15_03823 [Wallemia mellicola]|nr:hypothetical protein E3Q15_03823 [Wallemia mellicola]
MLAYNELLELEGEKRQVFLLEYLSNVLEPSEPLSYLLVPQLSRDIRGSNYLDCLEVAKNIVNTWDLSNKALFVNSHPRIGQVAGLSKLSREEQASKRTPEDVLIKLDELNRAYEEKYPKQRFITFVNGRTRAEIIPEIESILSQSDGVQEFGSSNWLKELDRNINAIFLIAISRT